MLVRQMVSLGNLVDDDDADHRLQSRWRLSLLCYDMARKTVKPIGYFRGSDTRSGVLILARCFLSFFLSLEV
jgi:hypothetical protein